MLEFFLRLLSLTSVFLIVIILGFFIATPKLKDEALQNIAHKKDFAINMGKALAQKGRDNLPRLSRTTPKNIEKYEIHGLEDIKNQKKQMTNEVVEKNSHDPVALNRLPTKNLLQSETHNYRSSIVEPVVISGKTRIPPNLKKIRNQNPESINVAPELEKRRDDLRTVSKLEDFQSSKSKNIERDSQKITENLFYETPKVKEPSSQNITKLGKLVETTFSKKRAETRKRNEKLVSIFEKLEKASRRLEDR